MNYVSRQEVNREKPQQAVKDYLLWDATYIDSLGSAGGT